MQKLEKEASTPKATNHQKQKEVQLCFFDDDTPREIPEIPPHLKILQENISKINIMNMTPLEALNKLHQLQESLH